MQPFYNNKGTINSVHTTQGEQWYFTIKPNDGNQFGDIAESAPVTINTPPVASAQSVLPPSPTSADDLTAGYNYFDAEDDSQSGTEIRWYKDGGLQTAYNDDPTVPSSATSQGQEWYFTVKPKDGKEFGTLKTAVAVTLVNGPPEASGLLLSPAEPLTGEGLTASYTYYDADSNGQSGTELQWQKSTDGGITWSDSGSPVIKSGTDYTETLDSSNTAAGEQWRFMVKPNDGSQFGDLETSGTVTINTPPLATGQSVFPVSPTSADDLIAYFSYSDAEDDEQNGTEIKWYKDGVLQSGYNNKSTVSSDDTIPGQEWHFTVRPKDGKIFGTLAASIIKTINTAPAASSVYISPTDPIGADDLTANYTYSDTDGDSESGTGIRWYKDNVLQESYNDTLTVPSSATEYGKKWHFTVKIKDGKEFGTLVESSSVTINTQETTSENGNNNGDGNDNNTAGYEKSKVGFTTMFFNQLLSRDPEQNELDDLVAKLISGDIDGAGLVKDIIFSEESLAKTSNYTDLEFITFLYEAVFGRDPDTHGQNSWYTIISSGMAREEVVDNFVHTAEFEDLCILFGVTTYIIEDLTNEAEIEPDPEFLEETPEEDIQPAETPEDGIIDEIAFEEDAPEDPEARKKEEGSGKAAIFSQTQEISVFTKIFINIYQSIKNFFGNLFT